MKYASNKLRDMVRIIIEDLTPAMGAAKAAQQTYWLTDHYFGVGRVRLAMEPDLRINESDMVQLHQAVKGLIAGRPVQYVTGMAPFRDMMLNVDESVLIPRPETEMLVDLILANEVKSESLRILEAGTGSGCIALALKQEVPLWQVDAYDVSDKALAIARSNADRLGLNVTYFNADMSKPLLPLQGSWDILVSNPPYVRNSDKALMHANVLDHEPALALFVDDDDPLIYYRLLLEQSRIALIDGGRVYFEINEYLSEEVNRLLETYHYSQIELVKDFRDRLRFVKAIRKG